MNPPGAAFLDSLADLYHTDFSAQDPNGGSLPVDTVFAVALPCGHQRRSVARQTAGGATVQVTVDVLYFGFETALRLDDLIMIGPLKMRVTGLLDGYEVLAERRA